VRLRCRAHRYRSPSSKMARFVHDAERRAGRSRRHPGVVSALLPEGGAARVEDRGLMTREAIHGVPEEIDTVKIICS